MVNNVSMIKEEGMVQELGIPILEEAKEDDEVR
jgi:hypothetical protein